VFLFIIFHCRYLHLYLYTYNSVPHVPLCKYQIGYRNNSVIYPVHPVYTPCEINLFKNPNFKFQRTAVTIPTTCHNTNAYNHLMYHEEFSVTRGSLWMVSPDIETRRGSNMYVSTQSMVHNFSFINGDRVTAVPQLFQVPHNLSNWQIHYDAHKVFCRS